MRDRLGWRIVMIGLALAMLLTAAQAAGQRSITLDYDVRIVGNGETITLDKELRYAHELGRLADGMLMFVPLGEFVARAELPTISWAAGMTYQVSVYAPSVTAKGSCTIYDAAFEAVASADDGTIPAEGLPAGRYLLEVDVSAEGDDRYASTRSFAWLTVGESKQERDVR